MGQLLIVGDKMRNIDIAEELLDKHILSYLISVNCQSEIITTVKLENL